MMAFIFRTSSCWLVVQHFLCWYTYNTWFWSLIGASMTGEAAGPGAVEYQAQYPASGPGGEYQTAHEDVVRLLVSKDPTFSEEEMRGQLAAAEGHDAAFFTSAGKAGFSAGAAGSLATIQQSEAQQAQQGSSSAQQPQVDRRKTTTPPKMKFEQKKSDQVEAEMKKSVFYPLSYECPKLFPFPPCRLVMETVPKSCNLYYHANRCSSWTSGGEFDLDPHVR
ncbi:unnamed protein product, partial [Amoebophrya sp. A25]|eukprot:GSA25T00019689001.1